MSFKTKPRLLFVLIATLLPVSLALAAGSKSSEEKISSSEAKFIKDAAQGGMMEVALGKLAQQKASSDKVKEFGKRMEQDHSKANDELKKLASDKGVQLTSALDSKHKAKVDKLTKLSGADFDKRYMSDMVSDHKEDVKDFEKQAEKAKDADVKQFASKTLPTLKQHLQLAESTDKDVKASKSTSSKSGHEKTSSR
jgi:putative membrane protein